MRAALLNEATDAAPGRRLRPVRLPPVALAAAAVVIGAGAVVAMAVSSQQTRPTGASAAARTPAPSHLAASTPPGGLPTVPDIVRGIPPALMTDTGVPVVVLGRASDGRFVVTTPCGRRALITSGAPLYGATVVIDPGHGGPIDTGAVQNGIIERDLNLAVADALADDLRGRGISVVLTRTADYGAILPTRAALADALGARLMVSIHHNSAPSQPPTTDMPGTEVFVQASADSRRLGGLLYRGVTAALSAAYPIAWYHLPDAGVLRVTQGDGLETYGMIRNPSTTTALIEMGWLSSATEADAVYTSATYVPIAAKALGDAIGRYLVGAYAAVGVGHRTFTATPARGTDECGDPALQR